MSEGLFEDLLVIDCASFIAGPAAATIMADFGARVIKIEPPGAGDGYRQFRFLPGAPSCEVDYGSILDNRNKEGLSLDLKQPEARAILETLVRKADVFVTNYPAPIREKLKLRAEDIRPLNDRLIYASITPYGEEGPDKDRTGYDATAFWARTGLMDRIRASPEAAPAFCVPGMGDHPTATALYAGIVSALYRRQKTGKGGHVTTSLLANGLWSNGVLMQASLCNADLNTGVTRGTRSALVEVYRCRCERWFMLAIINDTRDWPRLLACLGKEDWLGDPRFATTEARKANTPALVAQLEALFETEDWDVWRQRLAAGAIPSGQIGLVADQANDPQIRANNFLPEIPGGGGMRTIDSPVRLDEAKAPHRSAPAIGEHTEAILTELGFSAAEITRLAGKGAVAMGGRG